LKSLAIVLAAVLTATTAFGAKPSMPPAVRYNWQNVVIGGGGFSPGIVFSTAEKNLAYLRTDVGGAYRGDGKLQRWIPLQDAEWQNTVQARRGVAGEIWLIAQGHLYRSTDFGQSFSAIAPKDPFFRDMLFVTFGLGRAADEAQAPAVYAFGVRPTLGGLWRSIDGGFTWARINDDAHQWGLRSG
jgi:xyloglucan-specific exo-beta-1,4-glucanase